MCDRPSKLLLLENAFRSFASVIATHILAGQVDAQLDDYSILRRLWWFARYFNPLNLAWRYYSILAFRCRRGHLSRHHLALLNFECYPFAPPLPYLHGEALFSSAHYSVKRLEISGIFSSQGLLSFIAAYQGLQAIQFTLSSSGFGFLPNVTKAMAILGLFRVMVSPWIANKVYVEVDASADLMFMVDKDRVFPAAATATVAAAPSPVFMAEKAVTSSPPHSTVDTAEIYKEQTRKLAASPAVAASTTHLIPEAAFSAEMDGCKPKALAAAWALILLCLMGLSMRSYLPFPPDSTVPTHVIDRSIEFLYNYIAITSLGFHGLFLRQGARALGNRHPLFNHPLYHLQTAVFLLLLSATLVVGIVDFVQHDFYSNCFY